MPQLSKRISPSLGDSAVVDCQFQKAQVGNGFTITIQYGGFHKLRYPLNGWFLMEKPSINGWFGGYQHLISGNSIYVFPCHPINLSCYHHVCWLDTCYWFHYILGCHYLRHDLFLVGGLEHEFYFSIQLGMSSSQLTNSYFSEGVGSTTNQVNYHLLWKITFFNG